MESSMHPDTRREALLQEYAGLANSPDRGAKFRRANEVADVLAADFDVKVDRLAVPAEFQDAADHAPRERAVTKKAST